jgi:hypothetical protein
MEPMAIPALSPAESPLLLSSVVSEVFSAPESLLSLLTLPLPEFLGLDEGSDQLKSLAETLKQGGLMSKALTVTRVWLASAVIPWIRTTPSHGQGVNDNETTCEKITYDISTGIEGLVPAIGRGVIRGPVLHLNGSLGSRVGSLKRITRDAVTLMTGFDLRDLS